MKITALLFALLATGISIAEDKKDEASKLTQKELQQLLGITSTPIEIPEDYGNHYALRVELYQEGELKFNLGGGGIVPKERRVAIAFQDADSGFKVTRISSNGAIPTTVPSLFLEALSGAGIYNEISHLHQVKSDRTILYEKSYFQAKMEEDGKSYSTSNPEKKEIGKLIVYIELYKTK